jgi:hypothetical protein
MAVQERQPRGVKYKSSGIRMPEDKYKAIEDFAWERRLSMSAAISMLIGKALAAEKGVEYIPDGQKK